MEVNDIQNLELGFNEIQPANVPHLRVLNSNKASTLNKRISLLITPSNRQNTFLAEY